MAAARHFIRCLVAVLGKNLKLKQRELLTAALELLLPVALMGLLVWIRVKITTTDMPKMSYVDAPLNNPTWFPDKPIEVSKLGLDPQLTALLESICGEDQSSGACPMLFASTLSQREEHYTGSAIDGLLLVGLALKKQKLGVVGADGQGLFDFISSLPGYEKATRYFSSREEYNTYLRGRTYGLTEDEPQLFGAIDVRSAAKCSDTSCVGDWEIVVQLNASGPGVTDLEAATDIDMKLIPRVNKLQKGLLLAWAKVFWAGGRDILFSGDLPILIPTGGLMDLQNLIYAWIYNSTGAFQLPMPESLPKCRCADPFGAYSDDMSKCNETSLILTVVRSLTPHWSTSILGENAGCMGRFSGLFPLSIREVPFPTPEYTDDKFATFVKSVFGLFFVLVYIWPLTRIMKSLVEDKEARINEVMKMMSMPSEAITLGWYLTYGTAWIVPAILMVVVCWSTVFYHSNKLLVMLFFWLFAVCVVTLCSFIAVFFARAKTASVVGALIFFLLYFPYLFVSGAGTSIGTKTLACLSPPVALSFGAGLIAELESSGEGLRLGTLSVDVNNMTMARVYWMLIFNCFIFAALAWYFDKVFVVGFGTRQSWYFCMSRRFWRPSVAAVTEEEIHDLERGFDDTAPQNPRFEAVSADLAPRRSALIRKLCKSFPTADGKILHAVQDVTLNLYSGQIFCLLGHNGAGKTTMINMLSGMLPVSSGDAILYGKSVVQDMQQIRTFLGVCPQHDVIWVGLTVKEHLEFFAKVKGLSDEQIRSEVDSLIVIVGLQEKTNSLAGTLSGGQKRRLSAAIALVGGSKIVFLDEPSSGVDPFSRRELWDCFRQKKEGRTLILTTHFMDEAEELGDRIAIMAAGQLKCVGSALFLKAQFGVGYTLTITKRASAIGPSPEISALQLLVNSSCPRAEMISNVGTELAYKLPMEESRSFPALFAAMEADPAKYGIEIFGVSVTTLEEVFLRVGRDHTEADIAADERLQQISFVRQISERATITDRSEPVVGVAVNDHDASRSPLRGAEAVKSSCGRHVHALLAKRYHNARRDRKAWCCQVAMPLIFLLDALLVQKYAGIGMFEPAYLTAADIAEDQKVVFGSGPKVTEDQASNFLAGLDVDTIQLRGTLTAQDFSTALSNSYYRSDGSNRFGAFRLVSVPDWTQRAPKTVDDWLVAPFPQPGVVISGPGIGPSLPLLPNLTVPVGSLWNESAKLLVDGTKVPLDDLNNRLQVDLFWNSTSRDALPAFYQELQHATLRSALGSDRLGSSTVKIGNQPFPLTSGMKDLADTGMSINLALGFAFIPATVGAFVVLERETGSKHLQVISGVNFLSYWVSTWIWDILNYIVPAALSLLLFQVFGIDSLMSTTNLPFTIICVMLYGTCCTSFTYMLSFMFKSHTSAQNLLLIIYLFTGGILFIVEIVLVVIPSTQDLALNVLLYIFRILPNFCLADALSNLITRKNAAIWIQQGCPISGCSPAALKITGYDMLYMGVGGLVWFGITLVLELAFATPKLRSALQFGTVDAPLSLCPLDRDVQREKVRVLSGAADGEMIVVKGIRKVYPGRQGARPKVAVEDMYFAIPEGQCFGYLGMNGAGKTTTMKILTGEELCTSGEATLGGFDIKTQQNKVRRLLGYCPQFDALIGTLTAREHLTLFARIKGVPAAQLNAYVDNLLNRLTLHPYADKQAYTFSGGTRRKLSLGIALVGDPRCVFLDEPTTGVDPESRRFMWELISSTMRGRCVILTTHSMDECEALCSRIGIMVNGRLVCLGSASQLKSTHGYGYQFEVAFKADADLQTAHSKLRSFLEKRFPSGLRSEDGMGGLEVSGAPLHQRARYRLPKENAPISAIFRDIEEFRSALQISEYSVSETTLEQLFIQFARHQVEEGADAARIEAARAPGMESFEVDSAEVKPTSPLALRPVAESRRSFQLRTNEADTEGA